MSDAIEQYQEYQKLLDEKNAELRELYITFNKLQDVVQKYCDHPDTHVTEQYYDGSYYDKASTVYTTHCNICKKIIITETKTHSYYG